MNCVLAFFTCCSRKKYLAYYCSLTICKFIVVAVWNFSHMCRPSDNMALRLCGGKCIFFFHCDSILEIEERKQYCLFVLISYQVYVLRILSFFQILRKAYLGAKTEKRIRVEGPYKAVIVRFVRILHFPWL